MTLQYQLVPYVDDEGNQIQAVELQEEYPEIIYSYSDVKIITVPTEENAVLEFHYTIHKGVLQDELTSFFKNDIGDILVDIITNGVLPMEYKE